MADHSMLLSQQQQQDQQQQNGFPVGIDPSMLLLDPNPPSSRLPAPETLSISLSAASSASPASNSQAAQQDLPPAPPATSEAQKFLRPFTFSEALPYSPFSSISPLETRIIPIPTLASRAASNQLAHLVSQDEFIALNKNASGISSPPSDRSLDDVHQLLANNRIPQYNFKPLPHMASSKPKPESPAPASASNISANLQPVSRMVFGKANIPFRYPSPESPGEPKQNGNSTTTNSSVAGNGTGNGTTRPSSSSKTTPTRKVETTPKAKASAIPSNNADLNTQAPPSNFASIEINIPSLPPSYAAHPVVPKSESSASTSPKTNGHDYPPVKSDVSLSDDKPAQPATQVPKVETESEATKPMLTIELAPAPAFNPQDYHVVADLPDDSVQEMFGDLDQRQRAEAAFQDLFRLFQDVFEAEHNVSRQSGSVALITMTNDDEPTLTDAALRKTQSAVHKTINLGCFADVPVDDLLHMQRLCDGALRYASTLDLKLSSEATESEVDEWVAQLRYADAGMKAARLSLKIMTGGRDDKQLYSENVIQAAVDLFKKVMDTVIVPIAELRSSGPLERRFKHLASYKKVIAPVFMASQRLFQGMSTLVTAIDLSDVVINSLEYCASNLIFVENAHTERDSVLGVQAFDGLRLAAMDMLSQIFVQKPAQRRGIFDDILTSLEKLPIGKQSARQFKLADGKSIQPVSALIMRLIQASAGRVTDKTKSAPGALEDAMGEDVEAEGGGNDEQNQTSNAAVATITSEEEGAYEHELSIAELTDVATTLNSNAYFHAKYVIKFIVQRAQTSSKSADTPYRNLLDLFVEDFTACLEIPDWPSAELLLRLLMMAMFKLTENEKIPAPVKNMALEELGVIGASLARLRSVINKSANSPEAAGPDELDRLLSKLSTEALSEAPSPEDFLGWAGPCRSTLEYLEDRSSQDPHLRGAIAFTGADWAGRVCRLYNAQAEAAAAAAAANPEADDDEDGGKSSRANRQLERRNRDLGRLAYRLRVMIDDGRGLSGNRSFKTVSAAQAKLSYAIVTLRSPLGGSFNDIINILAMGMGSDQATVRSKSLKSITEVLETDPSIFDHRASVVGRLIMECCADSSVQVRDSALGLVSRAITLRPHLENTMIKTIIDRFMDSGVGVRKRAIKIARDVYLRNHSTEIRSDIANGLLHRIQDPDEGVRDLARLTIEEVWVAPFAETVAAAAEGTATTAGNSSLADHVVLILQTVKTGSVTPILDKVFQTILSPNAKSAGTNFEVCKRIVAVLFDLVDNPDTDDPEVPSGKEALQLMMIFAKADPRLFTFEQIRLLKPHVASVKDVQTAEDMAVARAVVVIYRRVLPQLSSVMKPFLEEVRANLLKSVANVTRTLLDDVMGCIWVISVLLKDYTGLVRLVMSSLRGAQKEEGLTEKDPLFEKKAKRFLRYALIVGMAGKHCDLDGQVDTFKQYFPNYQVTTVSKLMVDILCPFAMSPSLAMRRMALDAIGLVCQSWPRNFVLKNVYTAFHAAFNQRDPSLEIKIMQSLKEFLTQEEQRSETGGAGAKLGKPGRGEAAQNGGNGAGASSNKRQLTVMGGTTHDDVASATTQRFLGDITRIALGSVSEEAYLAAEILGSISRQGLVHPKETGVTMITLETSTMPKMAELAYREHRALHNKYETVLEREYVKAIQTAFKYQRDVIGDSRGATADPFVSKLHHLMLAVKDSKSKNRQRLLEKMCGQVDFEPAKLDVSKPMPHQLEFARFVIENLAFFEYVTVGELQLTVSTMEKIVHTTGVTISNAIDAEILEPAGDQKILAPTVIQNENGESITVPAPSGPTLRPGVDPRRLRQLATGCMILLCIWEARTFLCRQYGLKRDGHKGKGAGRDLTRAPSKVPGVTGDKFWEEISVTMKGLESEDFMAARCKALVELLTVDSEFKLEDEDMDEDPATPSEGEEDGGNERGRKRKAGGNTPGGRKKRQRSGSQRRKRGRPRKSAGPDEDAEGELDF